MVSPGYSDLLPQFNYYDDTSNPNGWHELVLSWDRDEKKMRFFIDGVQKYEGDHVFQDQFQIDNFLGYGTSASHSYRYVLHSISLSLFLSLSRARALSLSLSLSLSLYLSRTSTPPTPCLAHRRRHTLAATQTLAHSYISARLVETRSLVSRDHVQPLENCTSSAQRRALPGSMLT